MTHRRHTAADFSSAKVGDSILMDRLRAQKFNRLGDDCIKRCKIFVLMSNFLNCLENQLNSSFVTAALHSATFLQGSLLILDQFNVAFRRW